MFGCDAYAHIPKDKGGISSCRCPDSNGIIIIDKNTHVIVLLSLARAQTYVNVVRSGPGMRIRGYYCIPFTRACTWGKGVHMSAARSVETYLVYCCPVFAMTSVSSSTTATMTASSKPWFLTFDPQSKDVLIWKNGLRLKLRDGTTSGRITGVSVLSTVENTVMVSTFIMNVITS